MSTVVSKNIQLGADVTSTNNFTWYQPSTPDGTLRLGNGNSGTVSSLLAVTSAGNVGFGTNSPVERVDVSGNIGLAGNLAFTGTARRITGDFSNATHLNRTMFQTSVANSATVVGAIPNGTSAVSVFRAFNTADPTNSPFTEISANPGDSRLTAGALGSGTALPLTFYAGGSERMRLDTAGNLGLGVTPSAWSASAKALQIGAYSAVYQNASGYPELTFNVYQNSSNIYTYQVSSNPATRFSQTNGAFQWFIAPSGTAGNAISFTQAMTLDTSGKLLLGATSIAGSETLRVYNATNSRINIDQASNGIILGADASGPFIDTTGSNRLAVFIAGTERMRIDTAGRFMVGKTNTNELQAGGSGYFYVPGSQGFTSIVQTENTNNFMSYYNKVGTSGGFHIFLFNDSTVGSITTNGSSTAYNTSSDYRLKNITGPVANSGAYIDSLNPVEGTWKADGSTFVGLIAHEVQEVSRTQIATGEKDGAEMQAMDYSAAEIIANLIAEVKSLRRRLDAAGL